MTGGTASSVLGSVIVVAQNGEVLYHHVEKMLGDQPDPVKLKEAIMKLGDAGVASCECEGEDEE